MIKIKKIFKKIILVLPLALFLTAHQVIPENITVCEGQSVDFPWGSIEAADTSGIGNRSFRARLFDVVPIKNVTVSVMPRRYLVPSGETIGVRLYADGVLVVGISRVTDAEGRIAMPAKNAGICVGDRIVAVGEEKIETTDDFVRLINDNGGKAEITLVRDDKKIKVSLLAVYSEKDGGYKAGLWVRDSTAGIGTLTFYDTTKNTFAALGHGICDADTGLLMTVRRGSITACRVRSVIKGENGAAGELLGDFSGKEIGKIEKNSLCGISGETEVVPYGTPMEAATRFETKEGKAVILCDVDGKGPREYEIEITKVAKTLRSDGKNLTIKVTSPELIEKTGGIVQGMSGSPIIQNGRIVGAVTHVLVNDPTSGYGIFIENMLS